MRSGDAEIHYSTYGSGKPVLLLHGGLGNIEHWGNQIPALARAHRVIAIDSRGHGRSTRSSAGYSYKGMADDVIAVMDKLGIAKASIVGWSDGGIIGLELAMRRPERVEKVFAFGANSNVAGAKPDADKNPNFGAYFERARGDYTRLSPTPKEFDAFVEAMSTMWATQPDYKIEELGKIACPVAIADGDHDEAIKPEHTRELAKSIPGAKLVLLPNVSHFGLWQDPEGFNRVMLDFLDGR